MSLRSVLGNKHHLIPVENLRDAAHGGHQGHHYLVPVRVVPEHVPDAVGIMVARKDEHLRQVMVNEIMGKAVIHLGHALSPPMGISRNGLPDGLLQREIHDGRKVGVETVLVFIAALPVCKLRDGRSPAFADNVEMRIFIQDSLAPTAHRLLLVVRIGVHSETVKAGILYPPYGPLLEILESKRIVQIHIRH